MIARVRVRLALGAAVATLALAALSSCATLQRYEVLRTPVEDCEIRSNGEFCEEPERLPSPTVEIWAVEILDAEEQTILYIGDESWVAAGTTGELHVHSLIVGAAILCGVPAPFPRTCRARRLLVLDLLVLVHH